MNQRKQSFTWLLTAILLGMAGYAYYRAQVRQSATLARIAALDDCLSASNQQRAQAADRTMYSIKRTLCLTFNLPRDMQVLHRSEHIQARTQTLIDTLRMLREQVRKTNYLPKQSFHLSAQLSRYFAFVRATSGLNQPIAELAAACIPIDLQSLPATTLAALTYSELLLRRAEALALEEQAQKVSNNYDGFDSLRLLAVPAATTVAPGTEYRAQLLLAWQGRYSACSMQPIVEVNRIRISAPAGQALPVSFRVPNSSTRQPDTLHTQWQGSIRLQRYPNDTVLRIAVPYLVVKRPAR